MEDHLSSFYDTKKLGNIKDNNIRLTKAFKILKIKLKLSKQEDEECDEQEEEEDEDDDDDNE